MGSGFSTLPIRPNSRLLDRLLADPALRQRAPEAGYNYVISEYTCRHRARALPDACISARE
jgi:spore maturation protein CgeB